MTKLINSFSQLMFHKSSHLNAEINKDLIDEKKTWLNQKKNLKFSLKRQSTTKY
jgi:hypothetical protein